MPAPLTIKFNSMKSFISLLIIAMMMIVTNSCYYDKEELLYPGSVNGICTDTTASSYSKKVVPVFQQYCYSCHSGSFPSGNILMGTYSADKAVGQSGKLYGSVSHASGYSPMPQSGGKLNTCQLAAIKQWVDGGMLNN